MKSNRARLEKLEKQKQRDGAMWIPESSILREHFGLKEGEAVPVKMLPTEKEMMEGLSK